MATKSKKPRKSKNTDIKPTESAPAQVAPPVRKRLLPHNMAHEITLLKERVAELEKKLQSILSDK